MHIIDFIEKTIFTQEDYDALPQETRALYEKAKEAETAELLAWAEKCAKLEAEEAEAEQRARLEAIWKAGELGSSESPSSAW